MCRCATQVNYEYHIYHLHWYIPWNVQSDPHFYDQAENFVAIQIKVCVNMMTLEWQNFVWHNYYRFVLGWIITTILCMEGNGNMIPKWDVDIKSNWITQWRYYHGDFMSCLYMLSFHYVIIIALNMDFEGWINEV